MNTIVSAVCAPCTNPVKIGARPPTTKSTIAKNLSAREAAAFRPFFAAPAASPRGPFVEVGWLGDQDSNLD
jgi:hypothetical protein